MKLAMRPGGTPWKQALRPLRQRAAAVEMAFDQRAPRERGLLIVAAAVLLLWLADRMWLDAGWQQWRQLRQQHSLAAQAVQALDDASVQAQAQQQARRQQWLAEIAALRQRLGEASEPVQAGEAPAPAARRLVGPQEMLPLLGELLARQPGLRVRSLQSLGQTALDGHGAPAAGKAASAASAPADGESPTLYRHGVELVVEGSYADLLRYLQTLEALPQQLLWGALQLQVEQHPRVVLTLRVHTLSRQAGWVQL